MHVNVPLHFINEEQCVGVKMGGGSITHNLTEVEISCLPKDLPEFIEVDMIDVEVGTSLHLSDLALPEGVTVVALTYGEDRDIPVVGIAVRRGGGADDAEDTGADAAADDAADSSADSDGDDAE